ncbi:MAG TPA: hypothetical protein VNT56_01300 [Acidimicrobiales bacterium]|jgi:hypothetical protein|nr:hypothetical protein [Acidimicrobiales bacterium]
MAFGLPTEGEGGPFAGEGLAAADTAGPDDTVAALGERSGGGSAGPVVVVNEGGVVLGAVGVEQLAGAGSDATLASIMELLPSTVRPSVELSGLEEAEEAVLVTTSAGVLLGVVRPGTAGGGGEGGGEDEGGEEDDQEMDELQGTFLEIAHAVEEHFEGEDPSEEQVRAFLRDRLVAEGRTPEEADAYLAAMDSSGES